MNHIPMKLSGRCANGFERDRGSVIHALPAGTEYWGTALCGAKPGRRSAGWAAMQGSSLTCVACAKKVCSAQMSTVRSELDQQVVSRVGERDVTRAQLATAFDKVKPAGHWKNPIDATVRLTDDEMALVSEAISFFCGCSADFQNLSGGTYRVTAIGYFMAVGA